MNKYINNNLLLLSIFVLIIIYTHYSIQTNYVSHSKEPKIGDKVKNNNPSCKHYKSIGTVTNIKSLKEDTGKTITYKVENDGETYCKGQFLNKTMDQLSPY